ncbi:MAG: B12-binding domain-containing radical SAM protein [Desulfobacula sp.]|nr:B12-binding domain-containing radical SAM protein [Desulfobacula sp.]
MKVVLVQPPIGERVVNLSPPLGLAMIAAVIEDKTDTLNCIIGDMESNDDQIIADKILSYDPDLVGFSISTPATQVSKRIGKLIKNIRPEIFLIAGGAHSTIFPEELLESGFDYIVRGEGEQTVTELLDCLKRNLDPAHIRGLSYIEDEKGIVHNEDRELFRDLDKLPFPAWKYFPVNKFSNSFKKTKKYLPIFTSRGCPGKCNFCYRGIFGNKFRTRSHESIVNEIKYLKKTYDIEEFSILDDCFTINKKRAMRTCELLIEEEINLPWGIPSGIRVDTVTPELLSLLKNAGCYRLGFGVETGSDLIMKKIKKNITVDQVKKAVSLAKHENFVISCFFIIGLSGDTIETIEQTIRLAIELNPDLVQFGIATPYPGTEMYMDLESSCSILSKEWEYYDGFNFEKQIYKHENLTHEQIVTKFKEAYRRFYYRPGYICKRIAKIKTLHEIKGLFTAALKMIRMLGQS